MKQIAIIGAGGFGREILWLIRERARFSHDIQPWGFIDDNPELHGEIFCGIEIKGDLETLSREKDGIFAVCAIGSPITREKVVLHAVNMGIRFTTVIAPDVQSSEYIEIGEGGIICAGNILTTQVKIGKHVIINLDCTIGHDVIIKDYTTVAPGVHISGNCTIGKKVDIGTGANIIPGVTIGDESIIGAGATVISDVPPRVTAAGVPARIIKEHK